MLETSTKVQDKKDPSTLGQIPESSGNNIPYHCPSNLRAADSGDDDGSDSDEIPPSNPLLYTSEKSHALLTFTQASFFRSSSIYSMDIFRRNSRRPRSVFRVPS